MLSNDEILNLICKSANDELSRGEVIELIDQAVLANSLQDENDRLKAEVDRLKRIAEYWCQPKDELRE